MKKMLVAFMLVFLSNSAFASEPKKCTYPDYQKLDKYLGSATTTFVGVDKAVVLSLLREEMGPECIYANFQDDLGMTSVFRLTASNGVVYHIEVVLDVNGVATEVEILKILPGGPYTPPEAGVY